MPKLILDKKCSYEEAYRINEQSYDKEEFDLLLNSNIVSDTQRPYSLNQQLQLQPKFKNNIISVPNIPFPQQLHEILSNEAYSNIIAWLPHGKAFVIFDRELFEKVVSAKYFKQSKYRSFTRKLLRWNFVRIPSGPYMCGFKNEHFLRDDVSKSSNMKCDNLGPFEKKKALLSTKKAEKKVSPVENKLPTNDLTDLVLSCSSSSLETIKKAQMEQIQRSRLLNYLRSKQEYEFQCNKKMCNQNFEAGVTNNSIPHVPRFQDASPPDTSSLTLLPNTDERQKLQLVNKMLPKNNTVPVLPMQVLHEKFTTFFPQD